LDGGDFFDEVGVGQDDLLIFSDLFANVVEVFEDFFFFFFAGGGFDGFIDFLGLFFDTIEGRLDGLFLFFESGDGVFKGFLSVVSFVVVEEFNGVIELGTDGGVGGFVVEEVLDGKGESAVVVFIKGGEDVLDSFLEAEEGFSVVFEGFFFFVVAVFEIFQGLFEGFGVLAHFFGLLESGHGGLEVDVLVLSLGEVVQVFHGFLSSGSVFSLEGFQGHFHQGV